MTRRTFKQYLMESTRTYRYKLKIAGEPGKPWLDMFCYNLNKFDPVKISDPRRTPIQESPFGFPELKNESITIIDVEFKYPANEIMIRQLARLLNYDENRIRLIQSDSDDSWSNEAAMYKKQAEHSPLLGHTELEDGGDAAKEANKAYGDSYLQSIKKQNEADRKEATGGVDRKAAFDPYTKQERASSSPMTRITRPGLPATGAKK